MELRELREPMELREAEFPSAPSLYFSATFDEP
jgi:hypothetical protein